MGFGWEGVDQCEEDGKRDESAISAIRLHLICQKVNLYRLEQGRLDRLLVQKGLWAWRWSWRHVLSNGLGLMPYSEVPR